MRGNGTVNAFIAAEARLWPLLSTAVLLYMLHCMLVVQAWAPPVPTFHCLPKAIGSLPERNARPCMPRHVWLADIAIQPRVPRPLHALREHEAAELDCLPLLLAPYVHMHHYSLPSATPDGEDARYGVVPDAACVHGSCNAQGSCELRGRRMGNCSLSFYCESAFLVSNVGKPPVTCNPMARSSQVVLNSGAAPCLTCRTSTGLLVLLVLATAARLT